MKEEVQIEAQLLRSRGLKATPHRIAVLQALQRSIKPLSIESLKENLSPDAAVSQATLYRMMQELTRAGAVQQIDLRHGHAHYELAGDHHHHVICTQCSIIVNLSTCPIETQAAPTHAAFETILEHSLEFFGLCKKCAE